MDADCSLAASLLALDSRAAWELPELAELLSLPELLWEAELLSPESAWDELVLWEELAVPLEAEAEPAGKPCSHCWKSCETSCRRWM